MSPTPDSESDELHGDDLAQYLQMFVDETEEQLDDLVETMLVLEEAPQDANSLAAAFRLLHSMKGAAGMMGLDQITVLTHHLETRFERLRSGRITLDRVTMNLTLRCIDFLRQCNDRLREGVELATPDVLLVELRELEESTEKELEANAPAREAPQPPEAQQPDNSPVAAVDTEETDQPPTVRSAEVTLGEHYHVVLQIKPTVILQETSARLVTSSLDQIGEIKATRPDMNEWDSCEELSPLDVIIFTDLSPDQVLQHAMVEGISDADVRIPRDPDAEPLASSRGFVADTPQTQDASEEAPVTATNETDGPTTVSPQDNSANSAPPEVAAVPAKQTETMRVDIDRLDNLMSLAGELVVNRAQFVQVADDLGEGLRQSRSTHATRELQDTILRMIDRLDASDDMSSSDWSGSIAELRSGLQLLNEHQCVMEESRRSFGRLDEAIDQLSRVSNSLQRGVLGTRMIPVSPLFNRFKRVVRDLSQDRGKQVSLVLEGETTELDKRMIDALGDPLVHLVRNSVDHGMESPEERLNAGKHASGTITLSAQHRGNNVYITISDDGGGIDDVKIRQRLVERGLLSETEAQALSRSDAIAHIWHPGFSTAETVTDISGRGVGMDIVKSKITELAGTIETESELGGGTTFTLKLPLTLAIISSLLVQIRGIVFAIPKDDVREIVQIKKAEIVTVANRQTFEIRGQYLPLIQLEEVFDWQESSHPLEASESTIPESLTEIVILQSGDHLIGVQLDRALGSQDVVIKSLAENFVSIDGLAGASILGDGSVALMLDVTAMLKMAIGPTDRQPASFQSSAPMLDS